MNPISQTLDQAEKLLRFVREQVASMDARLQLTSHEEMETEKLHRFMLNLSAAVATLKESPPAGRVGRPSA